MEAVQSQRRGSIRGHQHAVALARRSRRVRSRRVQLRRDLTTGQVHLADLLKTPPEWALDMRLFDVLVALPRVWKTKARRALAAANATELTTLARVTTRQREALLDHFRTRHPGIWKLWGVMAWGPLGGQEA